MNTDITNQTIPLARLVPHPRNYNTHPQAQLRQLSASLARFGQVRSVVVQEPTIATGDYLIVAGHGLIDAARERGLADIRADVIPNTWDEVQIEGYLLADNLTQRESIPDDTMLLQLLQEQKHAGYDLLTIGSSEEELRDLLAQVDLPDPTMPTGGVDDSEEAFWPVLKLRVPDEIKERFETLLKKAVGKSPHAKLDRLLSCVDTSLLEQTAHLFDHKVWTRLPVVLGEAHDALDADEEWQGEQEEVQWPDLPDDDSDTDGGY